MEQCIGRNLKWKPSKGVMQVMRTKKKNNAMIPGNAEAENPRY